MGWRDAEPGRDSGPAPLVRLAEDIARIAAEYPRRQARASLDAVERLREALAPPEDAFLVGVVGTNGKTSTATYLARMLTASGDRTGLCVSPHLLDWTERVRIDDAPCDGDELVETLTRVHELAKTSVGDLTELRFFDVLTLAAELIVARGGASAAVFEAGIGGRLDALRVLRPRVVVLTAVALDHAELLGDELSGVLREKLLVASPGASVLSTRLDEGLKSLAEQLADEADFELSWADRRGGEQPPSVESLPRYLRSALVLAQDAWKLVEARRRGTVGRTDPPLLSIDPRIPGRFERGARQGVPYLLDTGHNEAAWRELGAELTRRSGELGGKPWTALVSVSPGKRSEVLPEALESIPLVTEAIVTRHTMLPAADPEPIAAEIGRRRGLNATAVDAVEEAIPLAFERAGQRNGGVLAFGSSHLVGDAMRWLGHRGP